MGIFYQPGQKITDRRFTAYKLNMTAIRVCTLRNNRFPLGNCQWNWGFDMFVSLITVNTAEIAFLCQLQPDKMKSRFFSDTTFPAI